MKLKPGEEVSVKASYEYWNHEFNTCIQQRIIMLDGNIVFELFDECCHGRIHTGSKDITFKAPAKAGIYLLWQYMDLMYNMPDAKNNAMARDLPNSVSSHLSWIEVVEQ